MLKAVLLSILGTAFLFGCNSADRRAEPFGKTYYLDGAGGWGYGTVEVPKGLKEAGYQGDVEIFVWTTSLNPLIDQLNLFGAAEGAGKRLADKIAKYKKRYPQNRVHIIALSAGTGVATWACEKLRGGACVDTVFFLGSSLSHDYDARKALANIRGKLYAYHSPHDAVLKSVEIVGTIDGKHGTKSVGQVGLRPLGKDYDKIVNIPWDTKWKQLGWNGAHTDCTNQVFVQEEIARRIMPTEPNTSSQIAQYGDR